MSKTWRRDDESDKRSGKENFKRTDRWSGCSEMNDSHDKKRGKGQGRKHEDVFDGIFS